MSQGILIARVRGIELRAHWSVLVMCALLAWGLADGLIPVYAPGTPEGISWLVAGVGSMILIASLAAHEVAHSLVARRLGLPVDDIMLWIFGGVSHIRGDWASARNEIAVAAAGPAVTLGLVGAFFGLTVGLSAAGAPALAVLAAEWLAGVNVLLLVFNLVPAFPLDGGRILRGVLWARRGDRSRATIAAARVGRIFGLVLVGLGLAYFFITGAFGGIWLAFIGWVLDGAARSEQRTETLRFALDGVRVRDVMSSNPIVVPSWITVQLLLEQYVARFPFATFPTHGIDGKIDGLVPVAGMRRVSMRARATKRAGEVGVPIDQVPVVHPDELVTDVFTRMSPRSGGHALVFDEDRLIGIISPSDVARRLHVGAPQQPAPTARPEAPPAT